MFLHIVLGKGFFMTSSSFTPTCEDILGSIEMLRGSNSLPRWSAHLQYGYTEVAKQALNCQIAFFMFKLMGHEGYKINIDLLPKITIYRAFEKYEKCDILEESYCELFKDSELQKNFIAYFNSKICNMTSSDFLNFLTVSEDSIEFQSYKAATAIATFIEVREIRKLISDKCYTEIYQRQFMRLSKYASFPIVRDILKVYNTNSFDSVPLYCLFEYFSSLRNRLRWVKRGPLRDYSVLGHSFDVAVLNYLLCLSNEPDKLNKASIGFLVGLYHDIPEIWTGDMPSPVKKAVPGLCEEVENFERKTLETRVFPYIYDWLLPDFKNIMLEMLPNRSLRNYYKEGDTLAAIIECYTQIITGSEDKYFDAVIISDYLKKDHAKMYKKIVNLIRKDSGISLYKVLLYKLNISKKFW